MLKRYDLDRVAPRTGAWIETGEINILEVKGLSPPARGRGLKQVEVEIENTRHYVAPRTGAWIETTNEASKVLGISVAPRTGAWIETQEI